MKIKFNKKKHTYEREGEEYTSVTTLVSKYFDKFDAKGVARKLAKFPINKANKRGVRYWLQTWKEQQEKGTLVHADIEKAINESIEPETLEGKNAIAWLNAKIPEGLSTTALEVVLFNDKYKLAGTADCLIFQEDRVTIIDWKVVKNISMKDDYNNKISKLGTPDSNYWKYSLQLNLYAFMLDASGWKPTELNLIQLTPNGVKVYRIPSMIEEVNKILKDRMEELK